MIKTIDNDEEPQITSVKSEELDTSLTKYQPLMPVHFEELNLIWPLDPRIPSPKSRRAWAVARGLNPVNVNNWWYRRRKVAKKLKISIPKERYNLDVGIPPILTIQTLSIKSEDVPALMIPDSPVVINSDPKDDITSLATHIPSSDDFSSISDSCVTTVTLVDPNCDETKLGVIVLDLELSTLPDHMETVNILPLSRQFSVSPPPQVTLFVQETVETWHLDDDPATYLETPRNTLCTERDALWASFYALDRFYPLTLLPTNMSGVPVSSCSSKSFWKLSAMPSERLSKIPPLEDSDASYVGDLSFLEAPWCINGFRIHFDGSMIGLCSCFDFVASALSSSDSNDLTVEAVRMECL